MISGPATRISVWFLCCNVGSTKAVTSGTRRALLQHENRKLTGWSRRGDALMKTFSFDRFADGIAFVNRVATAADEMNHHPDIDIRYTKITIALSTHDAGGITQSDLDLAQKIEGVRS